MVILVVFGDFSVFSVIFVVQICHICCHICIIFVILFYGTSAILMCHKNFFYTNLIHTRGNFGPNCHKRHARLVVKNGFFRKKWPFFGTNVDFSKKKIWSIMPPGISGDINLS